MMKKFKRRYQDIISLNNLLIAWQAFLNGKRKRADVIMFESRLMDNVFSLRRDLFDKKYVHGGYTAFNISDPKPRNIHKATVRDRLLHHLIYQELSHYFDSKFIHDSYSCRMSKGTHRALDRFRDFARIVSKNDTRTCWVLKCDIRKFFASIDHLVLKDILAQLIDDADILWLLHRVIDSFSTEGKKDVGLPLGNLTSQLLVNVYMNEFDQHMKRQFKVKYYLRYADDFAIFSDDKKYLENLLPQISDFLESRLKLSLHPDKVFIKTLASGVDFLGWIHFSEHRVLRNATKRRMFKRLDDNSKPEALSSYKGMLSHGNAHKLALHIGKVTVGNYPQ
jgi:retron-type reverse transcriptase